MQRYDRLYTDIVNLMSQRDELADYLKCKNNCTCEQNSQLQHQQQGNWFQVTGFYLYDTTCSEVNLNSLLRDALNQGYSQYFYKQGSTMSLAKQLRFDVLICDPMALQLRNT